MKLLSISAVIVLDCFQDATEFEIRDGDHTHTLSKDALIALGNKYVLNLDDNGKHENIID